ncbi:MAG TPA: hypothetical protein VGG11_19905 [Xanthobacteraceae bacterium]|jgi:hypothetical protein
MTTGTLHYGRGIIVLDSPAWLGNGAPGCDGPPRALVAPSELERAGIEAKDDRVRLSFDVLRLEDCEAWATNLRVVDDAPVQNGA